MLKRFFIVILGLYIGQILSISAQEVRQLKLGFLYEDRLVAVFSLEYQVKFEHSKSVLPINTDLDEIEFDCDLYYAYIKDYKIVNYLPSYKLFIDKIKVNKMCDIGATKTPARISIYWTLKNEKEKVLHRVRLNPTVVVIDNDIIKFKHQGGAWFNHSIGFVILVN